MRDSREMHPRSRLCGTSVFVLCRLICPLTRQNHVAKRRFCPRSRMVDTPLSCQVYEPYKYINFLYNAQRQQVCRISGYRVVIDSAARVNYCTSILYRFIYYASRSKMIRNNRCYFFLFHQRKNSYDEIISDMCKQFRHSH